MSNTVKVVLRPALSDGLHPIVLRFTAKRVRAFRTTGINIPIKFWNETGTVLQPHWVRKPHPNEVIYNGAIKALLIKAQALVLAHPAYTAAQLRDLLVDQPATASVAAPCFLVYFAGFVRNRSLVGHPRTAEKYASILSKVRQYVAGPALKGQSAAERTTQLLAVRLPFADLTTKWVRSYETHLMGLGNKESTVNKELGFLNTVLRQAVEDGDLGVDKNPFTRLRLKRPAPAPKAKLSDQQVNQLEELVLPLAQVLTLAREVWLLQYFLLGSRVGDVLTLRWRDVHAERVEFAEHKTGKHKLALRHPRLDVVLARLLAHHAALHQGQAPEPADFVVPMLRASAWYAQWPAALTWNELKNSPVYRPTWILLLRKVESATSQLNADLKRVQELAGLGGRPLTTHTARHSFADSGRRAGMAAADMRDLLNHHSISQTEQYFGQLEKGEAAERALGLYTKRPVPPA